MHTSSTLSEYVQAGLLGGTQVQAGHIFESHSRSSNDDRSSEQDISNPLWSTPQTVRPEQSTLDPYQSFVDELVHHIRPQLGLSTKEQQQALTVPHLQSPLGGQSAGNQVQSEHDRRQASNREHQRRFRQRQKVSPPASSVSLPVLLVEAAVADCSCPESTCKGPQRFGISGHFDLQARSQAVEAQLVRTTTELQQLKARQAELELLLQKTHILQKQLVSPVKMYAFGHVVSLARRSLHGHTFTARLVFY